MINCHLRLTEVTLADGSTAKFRALPFRRDTVTLFERMKTGDLSAQLDAMTISMSYDQTPEEIEAIFARDAIPVIDAGSESVLEKITAAMISQAKKTKG